MRFVRLALFLPLFLLSSLSFGATDSGPVKVIAVRPFLTSTTDQGMVYFQVSASGHCGTDTFRLDQNLGGGKQAFATILTAFVTGKSIIISSDVCTGWGSPVVSVAIGQW